MAANRRQSAPSIEPSTGNRDPLMQAQVDIYWRSVDARRRLAVLNPNSLIRAENLQTQLIQAMAPRAARGAK